MVPSLATRVRRALTAALGRAAKIQSTHGPVHRVCFGHYSRHVPSDAWSNSYGPSRDGAELPAWLCSICFEALFRTCRSCCRRRCTGCCCATHGRHRNCRGHRLGLADNHRPHAIRALAGAPSLCKACRSTGVGLSARDRLVISSRRRGNTLGTVRCGCCLTPRSTGGGNREPPVPGRRYSGHFRHPQADGLLLLPDQVVRYVSTAH